ncbi:MAG: dienelactone hydrolase family protein, partial [Verrucomicrobiae bacterium]|nr:dienelactone hydrolase family protein [Verrucomicrobiae bacterium]
MKSLPLFASRVAMTSTALLLIVGIQPVRAEVTGKEVNYSAEGTALKGYLAYDGAKKGKRPGVLVVHEWWGHNAYARKRAEMLAELGYVALAVDMFGDGKTADHPKDAG